MISAIGFFGSASLSGRASGTGNLTPRAEIDYFPEDPLTDARVRFTGLVSQNPGGKIVQYSWEIEEATGTREIENDTTFEQTWEEPGDYNVTLTVYGGSGEKDSTTVTVDVRSREPTADFSIDPSEPKPLQEVSFNGRKSSDNDNNITDYEWELEEVNGEDVFKSGSEITHTWDEEGVYEVTLIVTDADGNTDEELKYVDVTNEPPSAVITAEKEEVRTGARVQIDALDSVDPDGTIERYAWNVTGENGTIDTYSDDTISVNWYTPGTYQVELTVTDNLGKEDKTEATITVLNRPPIAEFEVTTSDPTQHESVSFDASSARDAEGELVEVVWTVETATGEQSYTGRQIEYTFEEAGEFDVTLTVEDEENEQSSTTKTISVTPATQQTTATPEPTTAAPRTTTASPRPTTTASPTPTTTATPTPTTTASLTQTTTDTGSVAPGDSQRTEDSFMTKALGALGLGSLGLYAMWQAMGKSPKTSGDSAGEASTGEITISANNRPVQEVQEEASQMADQALEDPFQDVSTTKASLQEAQSKLKSVANAYTEVDETDAAKSVETTIETLGYKIDALETTALSLETAKSMLPPEDAALEDVEREKLSKAVQHYDEAIATAENADIPTDRLQERLQEILDARARNK